MTGETTVPDDILPQFSPSEHHRARLSSSFLFSENP